MQDATPRFASSYEEAFVLCHGTRFEIRGSLASLVVCVTVLHSEFAVFGRCLFGNLDEDWDILETVELQFDDMMMGRVCSLPCPTSASPGEIQLGSVPIIAARAVTTLTFVALLGGRSILRTL